MAVQIPAAWELRGQINTNILSPALEVCDWIKGIATLSNNEIVALYGWHDKLFDFVNTDNFQYLLSQQLSPTDLTEPTHVSVNRDNEIIVLDKPDVKIFFRGYQPCLFQFQPGMETGSTPTCLAVDGGDVIAVGYGGKEEISLHKRDGSLIREIPAPKIGSNLTIHEQRLIYTFNGNHNERLLSSVDSNGTMIFSVDIPSNNQGNWHAEGLCCDKDGNIYVAVCGMPSANRHGEIHQFSHDGQYIGCVISECGYPGDVTCTPAGGLVLADGDKIKFYHQN